MDALTSQLSWERVKEVGWVPFAVAIGSVALTTILYFLYIAWNTKRSPDFDVERTFKTEKGTLAPFPSINDDPSLLVTIIVPAYKEEKRIGAMMTDMLGYLDRTAKKDSSFTWEIIIVDDGSPAPDRTKEIVQADYVNKRGSNAVRLLTLGRNHGKGGAVRKGVLRARGKYVLFADADGATSAADLGRLLASVREIEADGLGIAVGSRAAAEEAEGGPKANRTIFRKILGFGFRTIISLLVGGHSIRDTQCGFKLFTRRAAARVFPIQHIERWAFDVELLFLAAKFGVPMVEVPVTWNEIDGSTLSPAQAALQMLRDVVKIWLAYLTGIWSYSK